MSAVMEKNAWRLELPEPTTWGERLNAGHPDKYFMVTSDSHANEPLDFLSSRVDKKYKDRLPYVRVEEDGTQWLITEGWAPQPVKVPTERRDLLPELEDFESFEVLAPYTDRMEDEDVMRAASGRSIEQRLEHAELEGVDAEIIFPVKGLLCFATPDPEFSTAMTMAWNRWALEAFGDHFDRMMPMAMICGGDVDAAIAEVQWAAEHGFHGLFLPNRPIYNRLDQPRNRLEYNDKCFEPLWAAIQETGLPIVFHCSSGEDPRAVGGKGGAIINFHAAMGSAIEPLVTMIASGVFERFPKIRAGVIEGGIGWIPWVMNMMDHAYRAHHMWVRPVIPELPSTYFKRNCFASSLHEPEAMKYVVELGYEDNILWSNDYPHHEGTFPHSKVSIQRQMDFMTDEQRAKILGLNAARIFNIPNPYVRG